MKKFEIPKLAMAKFLSQREGKKIKILEYLKLGSGWHGTGYRITYKIGTKTKRAVLRTLSPVSFSHDYPSDRASVFVLQNKLFNLIPGHVKSIDVGGYTPQGKLISLGDATEFFQIVEVADGVPYMKDLERIAKEGKLKDSDLKKAKLLSDYLATLHKMRFKGKVEVERSLKLRHLRDALGHGEMLMGVLDTYPERLDWLNKGTVAKLLSRAVRFNRRLSNLPIPLVRMHGDYHPGNIWFKGENDFILLDASREIWGVAADDVTTLAINYIWFSLRTTGRFDGPFKKLFLVFWNNYLQKTKDRFIEIAAPLFFAFRSVVVAHPTFYPEQSNTVRKKLFTFVLNILQERKFSREKVNSYLGVA